MAKRAKIRLEDLKKKEVKKTNKEPKAPKKVCPICKIGSEQCSNVMNCLYFLMK